MNKNISAGTRIVVLICSLALFAVIFLPLWRIDMTAPQYPEGLGLKIYANRLGGDVDIVNGLNHYIGMRTLHEQDFTEFKVLPYIIGALAGLGLLVALFRRRWAFMVWVAAYLLFAIAAMVDFYRWEYEYGHHLDPTAAIQVPGMSYQPPLIGFKQLLNFGVYSIPDSGGMIFIGVAIAMVVFTIIEWKRSRKPRLIKPAKILAAISLIVFFSSCNTEPKPIQFGTDACNFCKMTIADRRFGGEIVTGKGKVYKFDDIHCMQAFLQSDYISAADLSGIYLLDFSGTNEFIEAGKSFLLKGDMVRSPMGSNTAAFKNVDSGEKWKAVWGAQQLRWSDIYNKP